MFVQLSSSVGGSGLDVWFVLLEKPEVEGYGENLGTDMKILTLEESYQRLVEVDKKDTQVRLQLGPDRNMVSNETMLLI